MKAWIIILVVYFGGDSKGRVDIMQTDLFFKNPIDCNEFRLSEEFQDELRKQYKGKGIDYVRPYCRPTKDTDDKLIANIYNI